MTEATDNLMLEHLRAIRADIATINSNMRDVKARGFRPLKATLPPCTADQARTALTLDDLAARVERLEKRTGLIEA
jgi:hypothetical protein